MVELVLSLSKHYTDKQGWEAAELAPRVAAKRWLQYRAGVEVFDVRPPTRIDGREELQVVAQVVSSTYDRALRASGTDGVMTRPFYTTACVCNQDSRFRRAGCGVFFSIDDNRNCYFTLPGREQTNNRELSAVIAAMQIHDGNLDTRSDSEYVVRIATSRVRGETQKCNEKNADLWNEFENVLKINDTRLEFVWVKGHATRAHIDRQVTTTLNKGGNDAADALASAAAAHHAAPRTLTGAAYERQRTA